MMRLVHEPISWLYRSVKYPSMSFFKYQQWRCLWFDGMVIDTLSMTCFERDFRPLILNAFKNSPPTYATRYTILRSLVQQNFSNPSFLQNDGQLWRTFFPPPPANDLVTWRIWVLASFNCLTVSMQTILTHSWNARRVTKTKKYWISVLHGD